PVLRIYSVPQDASDSDESEDGISEEEAVIVEQQNSEPSKTEVNNMSGHSQDGIEGQLKNTESVTQLRTTEPTES
ncbi:unnamed protein product, partial [Schistosoma curassoni]|uniref:E3 ubiquitin-protein ligase HECW2 n=1 Tax=Schistosoma curassoni TaxID=6186 RepID=A0A183JKQ1_9TREM